MFPAFLFQSKFLLQGVMYVCQVLEAPEIRPKRSLETSKSQVVNLGGWLHRVVRTHSSVDVS